MRLAKLAAAVVLGIALAGCSSTPATTATSSTAATDAASALLARHGLSGLSVQQVIDKLDASEQDRTEGPVGSVRPSQLVISDNQGQAQLPIPAGTFYLSIAPYLTKTHDCFFHNLATCKGELAGKTIHVVITNTATGAIVLDKDLTTYGNGFAGMWLPSGIKATLTVTYDGKTASQAIGTGADDPTCLTTLKLG